MTKNNKTNMEKSCIVLVTLMAALQGFYAIYAYVDPVAFASLRGTELIASGDIDWIKIYASRTLFVALMIGYLVYIKNYTILKYAALFGMVMPITDALLAYNIHAPNKVVIKHILTVLYLGVTFLMLRKIVNDKSNNSS